MDGRDASWFFWLEVTRSVFTILSVILSGIVFLWVTRQYRLAQRTFHERSYGDLYTQQQAITKLFLDEPEYRKYFYDGKDCADENQRLYCDILAEKITVSFEFMWLILPHLEKDVRDGWINFMRYIYGNSPAFRRHIGGKAFWYDPQMLKEIGYTERKK